ncbi:class I SAM-dependent methyltransferase [Rhodobacter capsulatus]|uniref:class I SAM-dependent methyltransferase n=1 Tax=Rhodobacter capsulatus TaxID=1061 RepID=UPI0040286409
MTAPALTCRACGAPLGPVFCDLGTMAVANSYLPPEADAGAEPRFPLCARVCSACRMVQLDHVVDAAGIFSDYAYFSSASASWLAHAQRFCALMTDRLGLGPQSLVIEVASNDGYLLRNFVAAGVPCLGIEPAANVAATARAAGVPTEVAFLTPETATKSIATQGRQADLVVANNVLAHVPDINGFAAGLATLVAPGGVVSIEAPHLLSLVDGVQFDTIYHEHYAYWSALALERLLARHGLNVFDVETLPTHGGSIRYLAAREARPATAALLALRAKEANRGLDKDAFYQGFDARVRKVLQNFRAWAAAQQDMGRKLAAYGAAAKGNTFLNAAGIGADAFLAVADRSPAKVGRRLPGSHIPVVTPEALLALAPDEILILPWNIAPEIVAQLRGAGFTGGLWTAVPEMRRL